MATYDWDFLNDWCLWYVRIFLEFSKRNDPEAHTWFNSQSKLRPLDWRCVKKVENEFARSVVEFTTGMVSESVATRRALPGDFADSVALVREEERILAMRLPPEKTWAAIQQFEDQG